MQFTQEQLDLLKKYDNTWTLSSIAKLTLFVVLTCATIFGLYYVTFGSNEHIFINNLLKCYVAIQVLTLMFYGLLGIIAVIVMQVVIKQPKTQKTHAMFTGVQANGIGLPGLPVGNLICSSLHLTEAIMLAACGWTWTAFIYFGGFMLLRWAYLTLRGLAIKYFSSLDPKEILLFEGTVPEESPTDSIISLPFSNN